MSELRTAILTACFMGIVSTVTDIATHDDSMKKQLMSILGMISILAVISPFTPDGFTLSLGDTDFDEILSSDTQYIAEDISSIFLDSAKAKYDEYFIDILNKNDIKAAEVSTKLKLNENNELEIVSVDVSVNDLTVSDDIRTLLSQDIGETRINIMEAENEWIS